MRRIRYFFVLMLTGMGIFLMLYPWFSNWIYQTTVDTKVKTYEQNTQKTGQSDILNEWNMAKKYNRELVNSRVKLTEPYCDAELPENIRYDEVLNIDQNGIMCFVEIPKIEVSLPVYHGTSEAVLKKGAGHMEGSAFPVGGIGNRPFILAHTGMNTSRMFSDLTEMEEGDIFYIHVLDMQLPYRVCEIQTLLPEEAEALLPDKSRDLVSLVTCTPYGVNSHRLVVTGERMSDVEANSESKQDEKGKIQNSDWLQAYTEAICMGGMLTVILVLGLKIFRKVKVKG